MTEKLDLENYATIRTWHDNVAKNSRKKGKPSETTRRLHNLSMTRYISFTNLTPDEMIEEALKDVKKAKDRIDSFFEWLQDVEQQKKVAKKLGKSRWKALTWNSALTVAYSHIRSFYTHNGVNFGKFRIPKKEEPVSRKNDALPTNQIFKYDDERKMVYTDTGILQQFLSNLNFRDQTIALCLLSTSQDAEDLFSLNVGFVRQRSRPHNAKGEIPKRLFWSGKRRKTGEPFKTFFSQEATRFLRQYVEQERADANDDEPLFVINAYEYKRKSKLVKVGGRMNRHILGINFRNAQIKMGLIKETDKTHSPLRPKRFRHLFRHACGRAGIDEGFTHVFMGHVSNVSGQYLEMAPALLEAEYVKVEPFVTVYKTGAEEMVHEMKKSVVEMKEKHGDLAIKYGELVDKFLSLHTENRRLSEKVRALERRMDKFMQLVDLSADELNEIRSIIQDWREKRILRDIRDVDRQREEELKS